jgi:hypothetical protein
MKTTFTLKETSKPRRQNISATSGWIFTKFETKAKGTKSKFKKHKQNKDYMYPFLLLRI